MRNILVIEDSDIPLPIGEGISGDPLIEELHIREDGMVLPGPLFEVIDPSYGDRLGLRGYEPLSKLSLIEYLEAVEHEVFNGYDPEYVSSGFFIEVEIVI